VLNGEFKCINANGSLYFSTGNTYEAKDGYVYDNTGEPYNDEPIRHWEDFNIEYEPQLEPFLVESITLPYVIFYNDDDLGKLVRDTWIEWAKEQSNPKASWIVPYEGLSQPDKVADIRTGTADEEACTKCFDKYVKENLNK
jgi:hypothetical protein